MNYARRERRPLHLRLEASEHVIAGYAAGRDGSNIWLNPHAIESPAWLEWVEAWAIGSQERVREMRR